MRQNRIFKLLTNLCRIILAATFILSGFTKVIDPWGTALKVNEYLSIYGLEWLEPASMTFSIWLCGAELMMGCMLLFKVRIRLISIFALASMSSFPWLPSRRARVIPSRDGGFSGGGLRLTPGGPFLRNPTLLRMPLSSGGATGPTRSSPSSLWRFCLPALSSFSPCIWGTIATSTCR